MSLMALSMCAPPAHAEFTHTPEEVKCLADNIYWPEINPVHLTLLLHLL